jgi:dihydroxy-acid dehydratase
VVTVDVANRTLSVDLTEEEMDARLKALDPPVPNYTNGVLAKYGGMFDSASNGAVTNPGAKPE